MRSAVKAGDIFESLRANLETERPQSGKPGNWSSQMGLRQTIAVRALWGRCHEDRFSDDTNNES